MCDKGRSALRCCCVGLYDGLPVVSQVKNFSLWMDDFTVQRRKVSDRRLLAIMRKTTRYMEHIKTWSIILHISSISMFVISFYCSVEVRALAASCEGAHVSPPDRAGIDECTR